ncbi:hypothetical protein OGAPHI_005596 [Ogataea philodendri]|uniref:Cullin family profile domain-containing protein n=1 Tax=Ogataea philodendri TaxID=1378263 RepID=A0A9P8T1P2_9ASCO|nr:uncharacterized protein OGAPHI_005596 [Ogataea philodendri]KAH3662344.1 hypothetical protein OGAPHI_005596 [Ogataea philodendri]
MFLSAEEVMISLESNEMSIDKTGSLCPYKLRKNLSVSKKNTLTVLSNSETARYLESGETLTLRTSSLTSNVLLVVGSRHQQLVVVGNVNSTNILSVSQVEQRVLVFGNLINRLVFANNLRNRNGVINHGIISQSRHHINLPVVGDTPRTRTDFESVRMDHCVEESKDPGVVPSWRRLTNSPVLISQMRMSSKPPVTTSPTSVHHKTPSGVGEPFVELVHEHGPRLHFVVVGQFRIFVVCFKERIQHVPLVFGDSLVVFDFKELDKSVEFFLVLFRDHEVPVLDRRLGWNVSLVLFQNEFVSELVHFLEIPTDGDSRNSAKARITKSSGSYPRSAIYRTVPSIPIYGFPNTSKLSSLYLLNTLLTLLSTLIFAFSFTFLKPSANSGRVKKSLIAYVTFCWFLPRKNDAMSSDSINYFVYLFIMSLSLDAQNFFEVFASNAVSFVPHEQDDPSSNVSLVLDWIGEFLSVQSSDPVEPPLRIRNALKNVGAGNEHLFDGFLRLVRSILNKQGREIAKTIDSSPEPVSGLPHLFEWIVSTNQKTLYCTSLINLVSDQIKLVTRCSNAVFRKTALDPSVWRNVQTWYRDGLFGKSSPIRREDLIQTTQILNRIYLGDEMSQLVTELFKCEIKSHIGTQCSLVWNKPLLTDLSHYTHQILTPKFVDLLPPSDADCLTELVKNELVRLRIKEIFDIVVDYPDSTFALQELRECMTTASQQTQLVNTFIHLAEKRLLHAGVSTIDIIKCYISTIRSFLIIDHRGVLLDKVCRPIRSYLKEREDTIERIVFALLDTSSENKLIELAIELRQSGTKRQLTHELERDLNWTPDPVDALPDFRKGVVEDVVESLISIFDTKDVFMSELTKVFSEQLLKITNYDVREVYTKLQLLKSRFGNSEFGSLDVMMKDIILSRKLDKAISSAHVHSSIISHLYWPELPKQEFKLPESIQQSLKNYEAQYRNHKKGRKLDIFPALSTVDMDVEIGGTTTNFKVSADKASILYSFLDMPPGSEVKLAIICMKLQMPLKLANDGLAFWVKNGVLLGVENRSFNASSSRCLSFVIRTPFLHHVRIGSQPPITTPGDELPEELVVRSYVREPPNRRTAMIETGVTSLRYSLVVVWEAPYATKCEDRLLDSLAVNTTFPFSSSTSGSWTLELEFLIWNKVDDGCRNALVAGSWSWWFPLTNCSFLIQNLMFFASGSSEMDPETLEMYFGSGYCTLAICGYEDEHTRAVMIW